MSGLFEGQIFALAAQSLSPVIVTEKPTVVFNTLRQANQSRSKEWDKAGQVSLSYRGNELAGEAGEACNVIKKIERERMGMVGSRATKEQLTEELADVIICVDLIAMSEGINLESAVARKFNSTSLNYGLATRMAE